MDTVRPHSAVADRTFVSNSPNGTLTIIVPYLRFLKRQSDMILIRERDSPSSRGGSVPLDLPLQTQTGVKQITGVPIREYLSNRKFDTTHLNYDSSGKRAVNVKTVV